MHATETARRCVAIILAWALGACAELSADAPLFSPSDQTGAPPLSEGIWIAVSEDCPERNLARTRYPASCLPMELRRAEDGAWRLEVRVDLTSGLTAEERIDAAEYAGPYRLVIAPALERGFDADAFAPLYLAEVSRVGADRVGYAVIAPLGDMPARTAMAMVTIGCAAILREGPIDGVVAHYDDDPRAQLIGCTASHQASVREAARRTVVEHFADMVQVRYTRVGP